MTYAGYKGRSRTDRLRRRRAAVLLHRFRCAGATKPDTTELYVAGTFKMFTLKYSHVVSKSIFGVANSRNSGYLDLTGTFPIMDNLTLTAHVGHQIVKNTGGAGTYTDGKVELATTLVTVRAVRWRHRNRCRQRASTPRSARSSLARQRPTR